MVQRDDTALAWRRSEFDPRWVHSIRRVAGYDSPGRFAKPCDHWSCGFNSHAFRFFGSMVKRKSCHGSNVEFRVQILVELLIDMVSVV
jgi:hypothetical protein